LKLALIVYNSRKSGGRTRHTQRGAEILTPPVHLPLYWFTVPQDEPLRLRHTVHKNVAIIRKFGLMRVEAFLQTVQHPIGYLLQTTVAKSVVAIEHVLLATADAAVVIEIEAHLAHMNHRNKGSDCQ
jgi:hypothetical protein